MAIRSFFRSHTRVIAAIAFAASMVGCVAEPAAQTQVAPPAYRAPADIRPAEIVAKAAAAPASEVTDPGFTVRGPVTAWTPSVKSRSWKYIVIHHSATPGGNALKFDREHKAKGWDELGYHFVIDNGNGGPDGRIEIGPRWPKQKWGAHAKTPDNRYNELGIGICFVGNFQDGKPSPKQMQSAARLVAWLMETYRIPATNVIGHEDTGKSTLCPGKFMSIAQVRTLANRAIADAGLNINELASGELPFSPLEEVAASDASAAFIAVPTDANAHLAAPITDRELMKSH